MKKMLDSLPRRTIFVGGGYIGFEFAHIAARAGSNVTIIHRGARPLPLFDPDLVDQLVARTRELGVDVHLGTQAEAIEQNADHLIVRVSASGQKRTFDADMVVHSAGRVPEIADLNLDAAGVEWHKAGVKVSEFLQSVSNPAVYAAGDAAASGGPPLSRRRLQLRATGSSKLLAFGVCRKACSCARRRLLRLNLLSAHF